MAHRGPAPVFHVVLIDTAKVCNVVTDGSQTTVNAGGQTREGEANQATLFFLVGEDDVYPRREYRALPRNEREQVCARVRMRDRALLAGIHCLTRGIREAK